MRLRWAYRQVTAQMGCACMQKLVYFHARLILLINQTGWQSP